MDYKDLLELLAKKKLAQATMDDSQPVEEPQHPESDEDSSDEEDTMMAKNEERHPSGLPGQVANPEDVRMMQNLNILDRIQMKRQGLDPWKSEDVKKYKSSQGV